PRPAPQPVASSPHCSTPQGTGNWISYREVCTVGENTYVYGYNKEEKEEKLIRNTLHCINTNKRVTFKQINPDHIFHGMVVSADETIAVITTLHEETVIISLYDIPTAKRLSRHKFPFLSKESETEYTLYHVIGIHNDLMVILLTCVNQNTLGFTHKLVMYHKDTPQLTIAHHITLSWNKQPQQYRIGTDGVYYNHYPLFPANSLPESAFVPFPSPIKTIKFLKNSSS